MRGGGGEPGVSARGPTGSRRRPGPKPSPGRGSERWRTEDGAGLRALDEAVGLDRRLVVYLGDRRLKDKGIEVLPFWEFVEELGRLFPA